MVTSSDRAREAGCFFRNASYVLMMFVCSREFFSFMIWDSSLLYIRAMTPGLEERHALFSEYQRSAKLVIYTLVSR